MLSQKAADLISECYADLREQEDLPTEKAKVCNNNSDIIAQLLVLFLI